MPGDPLHPPVNDPEEPAPDLETKSGSEEMQLQHAVDALDAPDVSVQREDQPLKQINEEADEEHRVAERGQQ